ncbi:PBS lyase HEAT domain protein repeat-containing protein [[Leptolyngbya] sp. PCC 7376]|uniref:HEAT repeat domain-containing protein n=1 Tax=[Leptolyngbya] sp. PCC 7376 TaxID=111781 RepID=UPI00029F0EA6|nr:HEAT repeat domain-containing protein [[Leptolyngbya] sp. PCC 7376]AFY38612.1 PBS lyase HEAT domain protein repeat-containing protein [[Leptolyngbya] sp. PCC 7376]
MGDSDWKMAEAWTLEEAIANIQQTEDLGKRYYAAWWFGRFRVQDDRALAALLDALKDEADRSPDGGYPLRRNAAKALGKLNNPNVVEPLIGCLDSEDYYVRESAAQSLELLKDERSISPLRKMLVGGIEAAVLKEGKPHFVQPYEAIIEALGAMCATEAIADIQVFLEHDAEKIRYATLRAMYQLTGKAIYAEQLIDALGGDTLQLRRSALMDLGAVGYVPAGPAIANTLAENSLKLISLKGVLEAHLNRTNSKLDAEGDNLLQLMDSLL